MYQLPLSPQETRNLIGRSQQGDRAAAERLLEVYEIKIQQIARSVLTYYIGNEFSDAIQEARISFWTAILDYDLERKTNFEYFAKLCIKKQLISKMKTAKKCRNKPLNEGESLEAPIDASDPNGLSEYDMIPDESVNIEKDIIAKHEAKWLDDNLKRRLTELEWNTYIRYNDGYTYREIAVELERTEKTIDNAIMRVRNKAKDVAKQYISNILVKEEQCEIDNIAKKYGWNNIDEMASSFSNGVFHFEEKLKKERKTKSESTNRRNNSTHVSKTQKTTNSL